MQRTKNREDKCKPHSFSCDDKTFGTFEDNVMHFEVISIALKLNPRPKNTSKMAFRSPEIQKFLYKFNEVVEKINTKAEGEKDV